MSQQITTDLIEVQGIFKNIFQDELHQKRQLSLANAALGLLQSESLFLHEMGDGLAKIKGTEKKHATKQIDRLLSNDGICIWDLSAKWVPYIIGEQKKLMVAMDWTSFANDKQLTLCLNIITSKGCATPLLWKTIDDQQLKHNRARYEDQMLSRLKDVLPFGVEVTIVADRGFADKKFFKFISEELGFKYIIRIKSNTFVTDIYGKSLKAAEWLDKAGRVYALKNAKITKENYEISRVAIVKEKGMKDIWVLASNSELVPREIINCYAKRWKIEPYFRDVKDGRFGYGLRSTHIKASSRRNYWGHSICYFLVGVKTGNRLLFVALLC